MNSFVLRFAAVLIPFGIIEIRTSFFSEPLQYLSADVLAWILKALGWQDVVHQGMLVSFHAGTFAVGAECTGLPLAVLLAAFIVAYPAAWSARAVGFILGCGVLTVANFARLVLCAYVLREHAAWFPFIHEYLWQLGLIGLTLALAHAWTRSFAHE